MDWSDTTHLSNFSPWSYTNPTHCHSYLFVYNLLFTLNNWYPQSKFRKVKEEEKRKSLKVRRILEWKMAANKLVIGQRSSNQ